MLFLNATATTEIYTYGHTLSLHDALPIFALDGGDDPRDRHPAAMRQKLLFLAAHEQREVDRLRDEQHRRDGKDELADKAFRPQAERHAAGPMRLTSHASV